MPPVSAKQSSSGGGGGIKRTKSSSSKPPRKRARAASSSEKELVDNERQEEQQQQHEETSVRLNKHQIEVADKSTAVELIAPNSEITLTGVVYKDSLEGYLVIKVQLQGQSYVGMLTSSEARDLHFRKRVNDAAAACSNHDEERCLRNGKKRGPAPTRKNNKRTSSPDSSSKDNNNNNNNNDEARDVDEEDQEKVTERAKNEESTSPIERLRSMTSSKIDEMVKASGTATRPNNDPLDVNRKQTSSFNTPDINEWTNQLKGLSSSDANIWHNNSKTSDAQ